MTEHAAAGAVQPPAIELYAWATPAGQKVAIMLEETGLPYAVHAADTGTDTGLHPGFVAASPRGQVTAIRDPAGPAGDPYDVFAAGAILIYLAEKTGQFWPQSHPERYDTLKWLMFQTSGVGPVFGQAHHFRHFAAEKSDYAIDRLTDEAGWLYRLLDERLGDAAYLAGDFYSIADIATYPWVRSIDSTGHELEQFKHLTRWFEAVNDRPAVQTGMAALARIGNAVDPSATAGPRYLRMIPETPRRRSPPGGES